MKFLETHRKDLFYAMEEYSFRQDDFAYVKRKGRIHILYEKQNTHFAYLRKKETHIDAKTKQWVNIEYFKVHVKGEKEVDLSWDQLIQRFKNWLSNLNT